MEQFELKKPHAVLLRCSFMLSSNSACHDPCSALFSVSLQPSVLFLDFRASVPWERVVKICCIAVFCLGACNVEGVFFLGEVDTLWCERASAVYP